MVVLVPAEEVVSLTAELPAKPGSRWQQAVPYAVEEQLADNIEDLHIAIGARSADGASVAVTAVTKDKMRGWTQQLADAGIVCNAIYPDHVLLPNNPGQVVGLLQGETMLVRPINSAPVAVPAEPLGQAFDIACGEQSAEHYSLLLYASPNEWQQKSAGVDALRERSAVLERELAHFRQ